MAIPQSTTMERILEDSVATRRFEMDLSVAFALSALLLASLGIYGEISFTVARRTAEISIRIALGARKRQILGMILRHAAYPVVVGLAGGCIGEPAYCEPMESLLTTRRRCPGLRFLS